MAAAPELYLGLISGTSADGIDVALASFDPAPQLHASLTQPYADSLRRRILDLAQGDGRIALDELGALDVEIGRAFGAASIRLLSQAGVAAGSVRAIGSHGQTVRHRPDGDAPYTLQLGDPNMGAAVPRPVARDRNVGSSACRCEGVPGRGGEGVRPFVMMS